MIKAKVLIVEDERIIVRDLQHSLQQLGYQVSGWAQDSVEAINKVKEVQPDIVLMDIFIAGQIDGIETARIIKTSYEVPIVFLTAYSDSETIERAKQVLPYAYLLKPFSDSELMAAIELSIHRFNQEKEVNRLNKQFNGLLEMHVENKELETEDAITLLSGKASLFNTIPDSLFIITSEGEILESNTKARNLLESYDGAGNFYDLVSFRETSFSELMSKLRDKGLWNGSVFLKGIAEKETGMTIRRLYPAKDCTLFMVSLHVAGAAVVEGENQQMEDLSQRLNTLTGHLDNVVIYESGSGRDYVSNNVSKMLGFNVHDFRNHEFFWTLIHPDDFDRINETSYKWYYQDTTDNWMESYRMKRSDGSYIWVQDQMYQVKNNFGVKYKIGLLINIDELVSKEHLLRERELQLQKSVEDKDTLIQEIHHRVRNNLQIITSLLKLQSTFVDDLLVQRLIHDSQNRVRVLSLVHENLYRSDDMSKINLSDYIRNLGNQLYRNHRVDITKYELIFELENALVPVDIAIPAGLIVNELLSNVFKHAFTEKESGNIRVILQYKDDILRLAVEDNGSGMPENFDVHAGESLGMMLVKSLSEQVQGKLEYRGDQGAYFEITIPLTQTISLENVSSRSQQT